MNPPPARCPGVRVAGSGIALPPRVVTNDDLAQKVDTSDAWIYQRTKMRERRVADEGQTVVTLGAQAVSKALDTAELKPGDLDFLICASITSETTCPASATRILSELAGDERITAGGSDLVAACSGFVYGINMAAALISTGMYRHIAVVGSEVMSRIMNWHDRSTCVLFGDAAGAVVLSAAPDDPQTGCLYQSMHADGHGWKHLFIPPDESYLPEPCNFYNGEPGTLQMAGREVYKFAVHTIIETIEDALKKTGLQLDDLAMIVAHQSNGRIIESAVQKLGLPPERLHLNIERYANTSAASVPLSFHELIDEGRLTPGSGQLVLFIAMGAGLTWANSLWRI